MGEFIGNKPSSRVLRPPGGQTSNIFGGSDEAPYGEKNGNTKSTFRSSVFNTEPEQVKPRNSINRQGNMSNIILGTESDNKNTHADKKISKTQQSSVFQGPEPLTEEKLKAMAEHRISNIPMFSTTGHEEFKRPLRRPITAPTQMPTSSFNVYAGTNYPTDSKPGPGERAKSRAGYKPANQNLLSTVFNTKTETMKGKRPCTSAEVKPALLFIPAKPRIRTRPLNKNELSSIFPREDDVAEIKNECQKRPMSVTTVTLNGIIGSRKDELDKEVKNEYNVKQKPTNDTYRSKVFESSEKGNMYTVYSADGRMACLSKQKSGARKLQESSVLKEDTTVEKRSSSIWSTSDHGVIRCTRRARCQGSDTMVSSSLFERERQCSPALWSSDFNMASCKSFATTVSNDTFRSTVFNLECNSDEDNALQSNLNSEIHFEDPPRTPSSEISSLSDEVELISKDLPMSVIIENDRDALHVEAVNSSSFSDSDIRL